MVRRVDKSAHDAVLVELHLHLEVVRQVTRLIAAHLKSCVDRAGLRIDHNRAGHDAVVKIAGDSVHVNFELARALAECRVVEAVQRSVIPSRRSAGHLCEVNRCSSRAEQRDSCQGKHITIINNTRVYLGHKQHTY